MSTTYVLWGRMSDGTPIKIESGTLPAMRREHAYRKPLQATGGFTDLRIREQGHAYSSCACSTCDTDSRKAEGIYRQCVEQTEQLRTFLGDAYEAFLWETDEDDVNAEAANQ